MAEDIDETRHDEDDFLAFWTEHTAKRDRPTKRILGVDVAVPNDIPLEFEDTAAELEKSEKREDFERLLVILFGEGTYQQWKSRGLTGQQLQVLVAWGMANASGKGITFAEAAELVERAEAKKAQERAEGKAPQPANRAARRASSKTRASESTGRSSKRTSRASTG